ncbi:hypothetical protein [Streptomyces sp. NPDC056661]|uniref:hypothetical protein n=1 Tax=Streptomyces sp. NPDC056661 TaxID=3345898 RepID=UPI0036817A5A
MTARLRRPSASASHPRHSQTRQARRGLPPSPHLAELAVIDPWWNPPWPIPWQRAYHHAHTHPQHPTTRHWLDRQRRAWPLLHPHQQQLLTGIGITTPT